ncbi:glutathione S-transferase family protein [Nannocystis sp.]|uniref:glutathione S-transferase family protein n=1 Tax=Nannocystis sp. TaxID=1962667 RepID=UPI0025DE82FE|nr:glutathione S-transferase [Nannocystis sp.]MBK7829456.1 glutathione S-transferase [Nannocystis sp.]
MTIKICVHPLSGHSHRVRLFASLFGLELELVEVDLARGAHKQPEFLQLNPFGQVPVLSHAGAVIADSNAILIYLAKTFGPSDWLPEDPVGAATVQRWLSVAAGPIAYGPAMARLITVFGAQYDPAQIVPRAHAILRLLDRELHDHEFLVGDRPTLADVACYSYVAHAPEGNVSLAEYEDVRAWLARIEALPGFVPMQSTHVGLVA